MSSTRLQPGALDAPQPACNNQPTDAHRARRPSRRTRPKEANVNLIARIIDAMHARAERRAVECAEWNRRRRAVARETRAMVQEYEQRKWEHEAAGHRVVDAMRRNK